MITKYDEYISQLSEKLLFIDEHGKNIIYDSGEYRIAVDDTDDARYITLWYLDKNKYVKVGFLDAWTSKMKFKEHQGKYLSIRNVEIDKKHRGKGLGKKLYQALIDHAATDIKGVYSYLPNRVNKKEVPYIWKRHNAVTDGDYQFIELNK